MFDISWGKLVIIGVVALLVIGPKELPAVLRQLGQAMAKIRRMAAEFQGQFNEAMREAEMADLKKQFDDTTSSIKSTFDTTDIKNELEKMIQDPVGTAPGAPRPPPPRPPTLPRLGGRHPQLPRPPPPRSPPPRGRGSRSPCRRPSSPPRRSPRTSSRPRRADPPLPPPPSRNLLPRLR